MSMNVDLLRSLVSLAFLSCCSSSIIQTTALAPDFGAHSKSFIKSEARSLPATDAKTFLTTDCEPPSKSGTAPSVNLDADNPLFSSNNKPSMDEAMKDYIWNSIPEFVHLEIYNYLMRGRRQEPNGQVKMNMAGSGGKNSHEVDESGGKQRKAKKEVGPVTIKSLAFYRKALQDNLELDSLKSAAVAASTDAISSSSTGGVHEFLLHEFSAFDKEDLSEAIGNYVNCLISCFELLPLQTLSEEFTQNRPFISFVNRIDTGLLLDLIESLTNVGDGKTNITRDPERRDSLEERIFNLLCLLEHKTLHCWSSSVSALEKLRSMACQLDSVKILDFTDQFPNILPPSGKLCQPLFEALKHDPSSNSSKEPSVKKGGKEKKGPHDESPIITSKVVNRLSNLESLSKPYASFFQNTVLVSPRFQSNPIDYKGWTAIRFAALLENHAALKHFLLLSKSAFEAVSLISETTDECEFPEEIDLECVKECKMPDLRKQEMLKCSKVILHEFHRLLPIIQDHQMKAWIEGQLETIQLCIATNYTASDSSTASNSLSGCETAYEHTIVSRPPTDFEKLSRDIYRSMLKSLIMEKPVKSSKERQLYF